MGQPTHTLTAHVGRNQLWENGFFTNSKSFFWGPHIYKVNVLIRVIALFLITPFYIPQTNLWHSQLVFLKVGALRFKRREFWQLKPDVANNKFLWNKFFRETPTHGLFMDGDQLITQTGFIEKRINEDLVVGRTKLLIVKNISVLLVRIVIIKHLQKFAFEAKVKIEPNKLNLIYKFKTSLYAKQLSLKSKINITPHHKAIAPLLWI